MNNTKLVSIVIILAGVLIAGAVFLNGRDGSSAGSTHGGVDTSTTAENFVPVSESDHILGNPNADVLIVEYSDLECPGCQAYHPILNDIVDEYALNGNVAWVYRHFPIAQLHPKAVQEAEAAECVAELGGDTAFWEYIDIIFERSPSNNGLDLDLLPEFAEEVGVDRVAFDACMDSGHHADTVQDSINQGRAAGVDRTPYSFIVIRDTGDVLPAPGVQSADALRQVIDLAISSAAESDDHSPEGTMVPDEDAAMMEEEVDAAGIPHGDEGHEDDGHSHGADLDDELDTMIETE